MAKGNPIFAGLTDEQVKSILQKIASDLDLAGNVCRNEALRLGDHDSAYIFHALDAMLRGMGALADMASGEDVVGDFPAWLCGPYFHRENDVARVSTKGGAA